MHSAATENGIVLTIRILPFLVAALGLLALAPSASATHVQCGDTITQDTRLDSDLDCSTIIDPPVDCRGLLISADRPITLDLGGHTITGPGRGNCSPYRSEGISVQGSASTVQNGTVERYDDGISTAEDDANLFRLTLRENHEGFYGSAREIVNNRFEDNAHGIVIYPEEGAGTVTIARNTVTGTAGSGIYVSGPEDVLLDRNRVTDSGNWGIHLIPWIYWVPSHFVTDNGNYVVSRNRTDHNGRDGIYVEVPSTTITQNRASVNDELGIEAVPGVTDGGKNKARGNGNPAQCVGVICK